MPTVKLVVSDKARQRFVREFTDRGFSKRDAALIVDIAQNAAAKAYESMEMATVDLADSRNAGFQGLVLAMHLVGVMAPRIPANVYHARPTDGAWMKEILDNAGHG